MLTDRYGRTEMMEILKKADERGTDAAKSDLKFGTSTEYVPSDTTSSVENVNKLTTVQKFYDGQSIFITGGTGFMGKLLIEKLLRGCPGINCVYVLIRKKKEKNVLQRKEQLIDDTVNNLYVIYHHFYTTITFSYNSKTI